MASGNSRLKRPIMIHRNRKHPATARVLAGPRPLKRRKRKQQGGARWL